MAVLERLLHTAVTQDTEQGVPVAACRLLRMMDGGARACVRVHV